ncbi:hypothetical protein VaNZ11_001733 [Volvox africanus]|nr:hypothetical protein VaNZ11_001733 [Volvox africanus]
MPLTVQDKNSMRQLMVATDKANGYCFATLRGHTPYPPEMLYGNAGAGMSDRDIWLGMQEKFVDGEVVEATGLPPGVSEPPAPLPAPLLAAAAETAGREPLP